MSGDRRLKIGLVAVIVALVVALPFAMWYSRRLAARSAVTRYTVALDNALSTLSPNALGDTVLMRERGRVESYIALLYQRNVYYEADLLEMKVLSVESGEPTVTVQVYEKWRYIERDRKSRKQVSKPTTEESELRYTLLPDQNGRLAVYLSEIMEPQDSAGSKGGAWGK